MQVETDTTGRSARMRSLSPKRVRERLFLSYRAAQLASDRSSFRTLDRLQRHPAPAGEDVSTAVARLRALDGRPTMVRLGTTDIDALVDTFYYAYHLPPPEFDRQRPGMIWDLGANVGYTVAHLAHVCPQARVVGIELDSDNAQMARGNVEPWSDRCEIVQAAVWTEDGTLDYRRGSGYEYGFRVAPLDDAGALPNASAPAISLNTLLSRSGEDEIGYVKMDIEGAESRVLREKTEWAEKVRTIKVETHDPYSDEECRSDLRALGFEVTVDPRQPHHHVSVSGTRR